jgi:hypothetical protein
VKDTQRRYALAQRAFLFTAIKKLESLNAVRANPTSLWASPALAVPKEGSERYRFTVDLRRSNAQTEPMASSMRPAALGVDVPVRPGQPMLCKNRSLSCTLATRPCGRVAGDFLNSNDFGIYTPTRLIQGSTDAGNYFQGATQLFLEQAALRHRLLQWLDDILVHAQTEDELFQALHAFFTVCRTYGLRVHALKTGLFSTYATFCGRVFDKDGIRFHRSKFDALQSMQRPELACDLMQFTCALNWMRTSTPNYAEVVASLLGLLEDCYSEVGGRTKKKLRQLPLTPKWGPTHQRSFDQLKQHLAVQTKLAFPKSGK